MKILKSFSKTEISTLLILYFNLLLLAYIKLYKNGFHWLVYNVLWLLLPSFTHCPLLTSLSISFTFPKSPLSIFIVSTTLKLSSYNLFSSKKTKQMPLRLKKASLRVGGDLHLYRHRMLMSGTLESSIQVSKINVKLLSLGP